jgi:hypothetical protein
MTSGISESQILWITQIAQILDYVNINILHLKTQVLINVEGRLVFLGDSSAAPQNDVEYFVGSPLRSG